MIRTRKALAFEPTSPSFKRDGERGAALLMALLMLALLSVIAVAVLAAVSTEANIAVSDLQRTRTFYAAEAGIERMTNKFSAIFRTKTRPVDSDLNTIAQDYPSELVTDGFDFRQTLTKDTTRSSYNVEVPTGPYQGLNASVVPYNLTSTATMRSTGVEVRLEREMNNYLIPLFQFGTFGSKDLEFWPEPPMTFNGRVHANGNIYFGGDITFLSKVTTAEEAVVKKLRNDGTLTYTDNPRWRVTATNGTQTTVQLTEGSVDGGPKLSPLVNGRGDHPTSPTGTDNSTSTWMSDIKARPTAGTPYSSTPNKLDNMLQTRSMGVKKLELPLELDGKEPRELIKRRMTDDSTILSESRYHTKATIRILIDDETAGSGASNDAGIPATDAAGNVLGVKLSTFNPIQLDKATGGNALRVVTDAGAYANTVDWYQGDPARDKKALVVRSVRSYSPAATQASSVTPLLSKSGGLNATSGEFTTNKNNAAIPKQDNDAVIPAGAGIKGRILIQIVKPDGTTIDVTKEILSMGMTVGEPNAIVHLQRPVWAAFMQGSRDREGDSTHHNFLTYFFDNSVVNRRCLADGAVNKDIPFHASGYISSTDAVLDDDVYTGTDYFLPETTSSSKKMSRDDKPPTTGLNRIVPINIYNVREGRIDETFTTYPTPKLATDKLYTRGIGSVVEINMRNLARWVDGVYDTTLLKATDAVSANIGADDGYVVYVSDRRGDRVKTERNSATPAANILTTNGTVDNEDVYNYSASTPALDDGEDVIDSGYDVGQSTNKLKSLQNDTCELPDPVEVANYKSYNAGADYPMPSGVTGTTSVGGFTMQVRFNKAMYVNDWNPAPPAAASDCTTTGYHFRRAVRLFNGEDLLVLPSGTDKLSSTKGITVATENMIYIWGNYNTEGINTAPGAGVACINDTAGSCYYKGDQVPASIVSDAFFPLSKTWYDGMAALYPEGADRRVADAGKTNDTDAIAVGDETSVRAGIIAGQTLSSMPSSLGGYFLFRLNGGVHNYPRFLETWSSSTDPPPWTDKRWNYVGSYIILYNSTQAVGPYGVIGSVIYYPPARNWAFDQTFLTVDKLPPGTPMFQFIQPTAFRQVFAD
ncbi:MAG: PilX N-terminal domain-containing pilus assembly protein [Pyrinomonadaceae bacterium]